MWAEPFIFPFKKLPYDLNIEAIGDWQLGSSSCCEWKIDQHIDRILYRAKKTPTGVLSVGDLEDEDRPSTRVMRAKIAAERKEVVKRDMDKHIMYLDKFLIPKLLRLHVGTEFGLLGGVAGHHWSQIAELSNSVEYIFRELEKRSGGKPVRYLGEMMSYLDFHFVGKDEAARKIGLLQHGEGGGSKTGTINRLEKSVKAFDADFFIRGHDCQLLATKVDQLTLPNLRTHDPAVGCRTRTLLNVGSATMGYEIGRGAPAYPEMSAMTPATMGWGTLEFQVRRALKQEDADLGLAVDVFARI